MTIGHLLGKMSFLVGFSANLAAFLVLDRPQTSLSGVNDARVSESVVLVDLSEHNCVSVAESVGELHVCDCARKCSGSLLSQANRVGHHVSSDGETQL